MKLPQEYFDNEKERAKIKMVVMEAIPKDVLYSNLIVAFSEMLTYFARKQLEDHYAEDEDE